MLREARSMDPSHNVDSSPDKQRDPEGAPGLESLVVGDASIHRPVTSVI